MKKRLLLTLCLGAFAFALHAQTVAPKVVSDVTSKLQNADFSADEPVSTVVYTYDYNMPDDGKGAGGEALFGLQPVTAWTANLPSDNIKVMQNDKDTNKRTDDANAKAGGVFAYFGPDDIQDETSPGLGGAYYAPISGDEVAAGGKALGMVAVWSAKMQYTQEVTLPAGDYMLLVKVYNASGSNAVASSCNGFINGAEGIYSAKTTYAPGVWETDTVVFRLAAETTGQISLGYAAANAGSGAMPHLFVDNVQLFQIETNYIDQLAINAAKEDLLAAIEEGKLYGVDVVPAQAVYDNPSATLAEVLQAIEDQKERNAAGLTDLSEAFINNPKFSEGTPVEGGICTYLRDMEKNNVTFYGSQPIPGWVATYPTDKDLTTDPGNNDPNGRASGIFRLGGDAFLGGSDYKAPTEMSNGSTEGNLLGVVTCWSKTVQYTQAVTLPAGQYTITMSYFNTGGANAVDKNLIGFIASDGKEYLGETKTFPVKEWKTDIVKFTLEEETNGNFSLGYKSTNTGSGNMPHLFVDGFSLIYVGSGINASLFALNAAVSAANKLLSEDFNEDLRKQLENAIDAGQALVSAQSDDDAANKAAADALNTLMNEVNASIEAYKNLAIFASELNAALDKYNETEYPELNTTLTDMKDDVDGALRNLDWTTDQINETIASLKTIVKAGVKKQWDAVIAEGKVLDKDLDISALFDQLAYPYSANAATNPTIEGWKKEGDGQFKTQYGTAEIWSGSAVNSFKVSSTISELPVGKYTITTKAFFRNADNATNAANYDETNTPEAFLFAGASKTGLTNVMALASDDDALVSEEQAAPWTAANGDNAAPYVPNSQQAAYNIFTNDAYTDLIQKSASTVVPQNGTLEFGIAGGNMEANCWTVWYTFSVSYNAPTAADVALALEGLKEEALEWQDKVDVVAEADNKIQAAVSAHENADQNSLEALMAVMSQYNEAIAYAQEADSIYQVLCERYELYDALMGDVESNEPQYTELMEFIGNNYEDAGGLESNAKMLEYIDAIKDGWAAFVQYPVLDEASLDNPGNITAAIYNNGFIDPATEAAGVGGWTYTREGGNAIKTGGTDENPACEFYNNDKFQISQTLKGLAEGYYRLRVQAFYRAGGAQHNADTLTVDPEAVKNVYLIAKTETGEKSVVVKNILQREDEDGVLETGTVTGGEGEVTVKYGEEEEFCIPNTMTAFVTYTEADLYWNQVDVHLNAGETLTLSLYKGRHIGDDWTIFDNFELYYLGAETAPDAINGVEAEGKPATVAIYNLAGQRVAKTVKGLYIVNGKKVVVK